MARDMLVSNFHETIDGADYVATGVARLRSGQEVGRAELRVPAVAVDASVVGSADVTNLKSALEAAVQVVARAKARAAGH
jgi:hypothetical protein